MDLEHKAIERLKLAAQMSEMYYNQPLIVTTSGGKDSNICIFLAQAAGIRFEVQHNHTTADAPETVWHIREQFKKLEARGISCTINFPRYKDEPVSMWKLIPQKRMPPTRTARYCCQILKEGGGAGRMLTTGVRWAESTRRKQNRGIYEAGRKLVLKNDNDDKRRLFENCRLKSARICNPIIDWTDQEVWDYIASEKIEICKLYQYGFQRVGCIGCPMAGKKGRKMQFSRYPTYERAYIHAFDRMIAVRHARKLPTVWKTGVDVMHWWLEDGVLPGQLMLEDME